MDNENGQRGAEIEGDNAVLVMIMRTVNTVLRLRMRMRIVNAVQRQRDNGQLDKRQKWEWSSQCRD